MLMRATGTKLNDPITPLILQNCRERPVLVQTITPPPTCFTTPASEWVRDTLRDDYDIHIEEDPRVVSRMAVDRPGRTLFLPLGYSWNVAHRLIYLGTLFIVGGAAFAPEVVSPAHLSDIAQLPAAPW